MNERTNAIIFLPIYCIIVRWASFLHSFEYSNFLPEESKVNSVTPAWAVLATTVDDFCRLCPLSVHCSCSNALFVIPLIHDPRRLRLKLIMRARTFGIDTHSTMPPRRKASHLMSNRNCPKFKACPLMELEVTFLLSSKV